MGQIIGDDPTGPGVLGTSTNGTGVKGAGSVGVEGTGSRGVEGTGEIGVYGTSTNGFAVYALCENWTAIYAASTKGIGIRTYSSNAEGVFGESSNAAGVSGVSFNGDGICGSSRNGLAGRFNGNVTISGQLNKGGGGFRIDHPLDPANKYLFHSFVESPDMKNLYDGIAVLDTQGEAVVELPLWFEALNQEFRYQLTPLGAAGPNLYIAEEISNRRFKIAGGGPGMKVCWQVTGSRKDAWAQANPLTVEQEKPTVEQGRYLHPELYGHSLEQSIHYSEILHEAVEEHEKTKED